jgi:hypothetical protein
MPQHRRLNKCASRFWRICLQNVKRHELSDPLGGLSQEGRRDVCLQVLECLGWITGVAALVMEYTCEHTSEHTCKLQKEDSPRRDGSRPTRISHWWYPLHHHFERHPMSYTNIEMVPFAPSNSSRLLKPSDIGLSRSQWRPKCRKVRF